MRRFPLAVLVMGLTVFPSVRPAPAATIDIWFCNAAGCGFAAGAPAPDASATDGINALPYTSTDTLDFNLNDGEANGGDTFVGSMTVTNVNGDLVGMNITGTATYNQPPGLAFLDVYAVQGYVPNPNTAGDPFAFGSEYLTGACNASATANDDAVYGQLRINGTFLPQMEGECSPFSQGAASLVNPPGWTIEAFAEFAFFGNNNNAETITLPLGGDAAVPEPAAWILAAPVLIGFALRKRRR